MTNNTLTTRPRLVAALASGLARRNDRHLLEVDTWGLKVTLNNDSDEALDWLEAQLKEAGL